MVIHATSECGHTDRSPPAELLLKMMDFYWQQRHLREYTFYQNQFNKIGEKVVIEYRRSVISCRELKTFTLFPPEYHTAKSKRKKYKISYWSDKTVMSLFQFKTDGNFFVVF